MRTSLQIGLERCVSEPPKILENARFGLLMNQASVDHQFHLSCDVLSRQFPNQLVSIFSPQHGVWGEQQANMIESGHAVYSPLQVPVFSLYSEVRCPTAAMLAELDCLVIDLQDVGTRVYTFIWSMLECLVACARHGKSVLLLDRPNPIGGQIFEGPMLDPSLLSFVGGAEIPLRHGLTMAELARLFVAELDIDVDLHWVPMQGWQRKMFFGDSGRNWVWPSPNMPTQTTTYLYPGQVLLEGSNLSEGRGTTRPFEVVGAPFLDPHQWLRELSGLQLPGVCLRPTRFVPTFDKWAGESCGGIDIQVIDASAVRSVALTAALIATAKRLAASQFQWLDPPYEYEYERPPIDILFGNSRLREFVDQPGLPTITSIALTELLDWDEASWKNRTAPYLLY